jgi:hypothetical protein
MLTKTTTNDRRGRLTLEEHEKAAALIRRFRRDLLLGDLNLSGRFPKQHKVMRSFRRMEWYLSVLQSDLDNDFCARFSHLRLYQTSPYYDEGRRLKHAKGNANLARANRG